MGAPVVDGGTAFGRRSGSLRLGRCRPAPGIGRLPQDWVAARAVCGGPPESAFTGRVPGHRGFAPLAWCVSLDLARRRGSSTRGLVGDR